MSGAPRLAHSTPINSKPIGLPSPTTLLTFDEVVLPNNTIVTNQYQTFGVTFSPNLVYNSQGQVNFPNVTGNNLGNFAPGLVDPFFIDFTTDVSAAAFAMVTNPTTSTFTALLNNVPVESFSVGTTFTSPNDFYGFTGITFNQIEVSTSGAFMLLDNLQFNSAVPEPTTLALLGTGLLGLVMMRRRKLSRTASSLA
jgi:hypothetical protein